MIETVDKLCEFAKSKGYTTENIELLLNAYKIADSYSKNKFRIRKPTRPFLNHLISTCAILMTTRMNIETVVAGLLHSVKDDPTVCALNQTVGEIVNNYFDLSIDCLGNPKQIDFDKVTNIQMAVMAIQLANTTDMVMAGEYKS